MMETILELRDVAVGYGARTLVSGATVTVGRGELVTLLGANGTGKSTLLRTLSGDMRPMEGSVGVMGRDESEIDRRELARLVSLVTTERIPGDGLLVEEVVEMGRHPYTGFFGRLGSDDRREVRGAMEAVGAWAFRGRRMGSLSDGERQKVMIARALAQVTPLILLDEPTAFLDVASRVEVLSLLRGLAAERGKGVVLSSHDVGSALDLSDRIWLLTGDGRMRVATPAELLEAQREGEPGNGLDELFRGRAVRFDQSRKDYIAACGREAKN